jgi:ABC-2 type transport system ATP-binding protein
MCVAAGLTTDRADQVLRGVDLAGAAGRRVGGFSLGMRQRLALASALLGDPAVLVLDEPANGLDPEGIRWLRDFLRAFAAGGGTVLISSHGLAEIGVLADRLVIVNGGRVVADGTTDELAGTAGLEDAYLDLVRSTR